MTVAKVLCYDPDDVAGMHGWHAQCVPDPVRWKCGRCGRGVVVLMIEGLPDIRIVCRCCGAHVEVYLEDGRRIYQGTPRVARPVRRF